MFVSKKRQPNILDVKMNHVQKNIYISEYNNKTTENVTRKFKSSYEYERCFLETKRNIRTVQNNIKNKENCTGVMCNI